MRVLVLVRPEMRGLTKIFLKVTYPIQANASPMCTSPTKGKKKKDKFVLLPVTTSQALEKIHFNTTHDIWKGKIYSTRNTY